MECRTHTDLGTLSPFDYTLTPSVRACGLRKFGMNVGDVAIDLFASELKAQAPIFCRVRLVLCDTRGSLYANKVESGFGPTLRLNIWVQLCKESCGSLFSF